MDILKLLSRGTKPSAKGVKSSSGFTGTLPSAGAQTNPQLFHDDVGPSRRQKRKRDAGNESDDGNAARKGDGGAESSEEQLPEIDFFAPKKEAPAKAIADEEQVCSKKRKTSAKDSDVPLETLPEDECKQLLRSHRLKFTVMSKPEVVAVKPKKSKKGATTTTPDKKDTKKAQLFPQPLVSFAQLRSSYQISPRLADNLARQSYRLPTEVQMASLPLLLRPEHALAHADDTIRQQAKERGGVDYLAVAPTGSGKTVSFMVPAIHATLRGRETDGGLAKGHILQTVIVAPTRELAFQIANEGKKIAAGTGVRIAAMRKGMRLAYVLTEEFADQDLSSEEEEEPNDDEEEDEEDDDDDVENTEDDEGAAPARPKGKKKLQRQAPLTNADIIVTTPLHLLNSLACPKSTRKTLPTVSSLVLDEADVLLDPLFREQTLRIWSACTNPDLRVSLWSATMGSNIEALVTERLKSSSPHPAPFLRLVVGLKDTAVPNITHKLIYAASEPGKLLALRQLLRPSGASDMPLRPPFLVFTQTIERASSLHSELKYDIPPAAGGPARIAALHGGFAEGARAAIMRRFRAGEIWVLITTDVLARGVDFAGVNGIVNYDVPGSPAAYVHRAGRTGRAGRAGGVAVTLYTKEDIPFVKSVANVIALSERQGGGPGGDGGAAGVQSWLLDALPDVSKEDRKKLKQKGVESRRAGAKGAIITTRSGWDRRRDNMRREAVAASKRRKKEGMREGRKEEAKESMSDEEWSGFDD